MNDLNKRSKTNGENQGTGCEGSVWGHTGPLTNNGSALLRTGLCFIGTHYVGVGSYPLGELCP